MRHSNRLQHWHIIAVFLVLYDFATAILAYFLPLWLRFDTRFSAIPIKYLSAYQSFILIYAAICIVVFYAFRLYRMLWRFAGFPELVRIGLAGIAVTVIHVIGMTAFYIRMPISYYCMGAILQCIFMVAIRFSYRAFLMMKSLQHKSDDPKARVMVIGAGSAGQMIIRDIAQNPELYGQVVCVIDDNDNKHGRFIDGVPIVGGRNDIFASVEKYGVDKIYLAIPSATAAERRDILSICNETSCEVKILPGMYQMISGEIHATSMREVKIEDLLGRDPIKVESEEIYRTLNGKTILVTGGGGSIGSELCRQIAAHGPKKLIIFDIYENNAYAIEQELRRERLNLDFVVEIGSVRDSRRVNQLFAKYKPDIVYHAAAHKHVPLMEGSPCEAIKNNVFGTYKTAYAAMIHGCRRFVLVSTDKAVNPTNVMGASKRMCEMIIQMFDKMIRERREYELPVFQTHGEDDLGDGGEPLILGQDNAGHRHAQTEFVAVRFGNVLGSNGSVIPLFKDMIARGGPVEVTHKDIIRYFMTVEEAVGLILQAGVYANGGEIFVLDMGEPMKIDTLARNLILLSGHTPDEDIKIVYTGLRPGEKLYEEKLMDEEGLSTTPNKLIHIGKPIAFDEHSFLEKLPGLMNAAYNNDENIRELIKELVTTYRGIS